MSLARMPLAQTVRVRSVRGNGPMACRLMEMGFIDGAEVEVVGRAPLGDPIQVRVGDYRLSLRREQAELVEIAH